MYISRIQYIVMFDRLRISNRTVLCTLYAAMSCTIRVCPVQYSYIFTLDILGTVKTSANNYVIDALFSIVE